MGEGFSRIVTVEDGVMKGGMGSALLEWMADQGYTPRVKRLGLPDQFVEHGSVKQLQAICAIDEASIQAAIEAML